MVWILTREINEYDQDGEYFVNVFKNKPTEADLCLNGIPDEETAKHVLGGGGRIGVEHTWWHLREHVVKREGWVAMYEDHQGRYLHGTTFDTKDAVKHACPNALGAIKIEWEEE